jgi:hypothetical protein
VAGVIPERAAVKDITPDRGCIDALGRFLLDVPLGAPVVEKLRRDAGPDKGTEHRRHNRSHANGGWGKVGEMPAPAPEMTGSNGGNDH